MPVMKTLTINGRTYTVTPVVPTDSVTLLASAWEGDERKYSQVVELSAVTPHTMVDLQPTPKQLTEFHDKVLGFVAENDGGVVTVFAIGDKPANDHTIQITKTEVEATGKIRGNTVGTTMPRSDWAQTDPTKADYIKNKPVEMGGTGDGSGQNVNAVLYTKQTLADEQKVQARDNIGAVGKSDILEEIKKKTKTNNLCDSSFEYGRFAASGSEYDGDNPITTAFRTVDYIPVEGGRTLMGSHNIMGAFDVVQYDSDLKIIVPRTTMYETTTKYDPHTLGLNENTAYVRFSIYYENANLNDVLINLFYKENIIEFFGADGGTFTYIPPVVTETVGEFIPTAKIRSALTGKKIVYDGDSIAQSRTNNGGAYAKIVAELTGGMYVNQAVGGGYLRSTSALGKTNHSVVDNLANLPTDGDLYCFEGGINDYWNNATLGTYTPSDFTGVLDTTTICGALETIFRYALNNFPGKPICFVIAHKVQNTAYVKNGAGDTFKDYRDTMVGICGKYSIPYYDAFSESGLNGWNDVQNNLYLNSNDESTPDGCHPNEAGYKRYYVPQLMKLFERIMPVD